MKNQNINQSQSVVNQQDGCVVRASASGVVDVGFAFESGETKHARFHVSHCIKKHTLKYRYLLLAYFEGEVISFRATESTKGLSAISTAAPCINWL